MKPVPPFEFRAAAQLLRAHGYTVEVLREQGDRRSVVVRLGAERWTASAPSATAALEAVLEEMFPSSLTRALLGAALGRGAEPDAARIVTESAPPPAATTTTRSAAPPSGGPIVEHRARRAG